MPFYDNWLTGTLNRLGYHKAQNNPLPPVFAGEGPVGEQVHWEGYNQQQIERLAVTSSWVYSDIRTIANEVGNTKLGVYAREGEEEAEVVDHDFEQIMSRPNRAMSGVWLKQYTIWWLLLHGEAYWLKAFDNTGALAEIWPIPAGRMKPIPDAKEYIRGYAYTPKHGRTPIVFEPEQVVFFRLPNPFEYHRGLSPLSAYRMALETDIAAARWNRDTFTNDVTLRTLITLPSEMSRPDYDRARREILDELVEKQRRFMIARGGDVTVTPMSITHKDLEFLKGREFTREEIDRVFGVPAGFWAKEATRANSEAAKATLIEQAVWPLCTLMQDEITAQILIPDYTDNLRGRFDDIRITDRGIILEERKVNWQVMTVDEARGELGKDPLGDETLVGMMGKLGTELPMPIMAATKSANGAELKADLKRWESVSRRQLKRGEPALYDFESEYIPGEMHASILTQLEAASTDEEVKAVFAAGFRSTDWEGYP